MHIQRNNMACSHNHCCHGNAAIRSVYSLATYVSQQYKNNSSHENETVRSLSAVNSIGTFGYATDTQECVTLLRYWAIKYLVLLSII